MAEPIKISYIVFALESLGDLLETHALLKEKGSRPFRCINYGVTTSMYFRDPDNNQVELQISVLRFKAGAKAAELVRMV